MAPWILLFLLLTPRTQEASAAIPDARDHLKVYDDIQVIDRASHLVGIADSASEGVTGQKELAERPILRPGSCWRRCRG
jgi:hypothetical protein